MDYQNWISIHGYCVQDQCRIPILLTTNHVVEGSNAQNLIKVIIDTLVAINGLTKVEVSNRSLCFGANGVNVVQGVMVNVNLLSLVYFFSYMVRYGLSSMTLSLCAQVIFRFYNVNQLQKSKSKPQTKFLPKFIFATISSII